MDVPVILIVAIMQREQFHQQTQKNDLFHQPSATKAQCIKATEKLAEVGLNCDNEHDKFFTGNWRGCVFLWTLDKKQQSSTN